MWQGQKKTKWRLRVRAFEDCGYRTSKKETLSSNEAGLVLSRRPPRPDSSAKTCWTAETWAANLLQQLLTRHQSHITSVFSPVTSQRRHGSDPELHHCIT